MKKLFLIILLCSIFGRANSQTNFTAGDFLEVFSEDSLKIYFNCLGGIQDRKCSDFYRVGKMDAGGWGFSGKILDYYLDGTLAFEGFTWSGSLYGPAIYYHENGSIKKKGVYENHLKKGLWEYFYSNGKKKMDIIFSEGEVSVNSYFKKSGRQMVSNGNGKFSVEFKNYRACAPFELSGKLENGKPDGRWKMMNPGAQMAFGFEVFKNGKFVKGIGPSGRVSYTDFQRLSFADFEAQENLFLLDNSFSCPGDYGIFLPKYKGDGLYNFFADMEQLTNEYLQENPIQDQWVLVSLNLSPVGEINEVNIRTSIKNEKLASYLREQISNTKGNWEAAKKQMEETAYPFFFTIIIQSNQAYSPELLRRNSR